MYVDGLDKTWVVQRLRRKCHQLFTDEFDEVDDLEEDEEEEISDNEEDEEEEVADGDKGAADGEEQLNNLD